MGQCDIDSPKGQLAFYMVKWSFFRKSVRKHSADSIITRECVVFKAFTQLNQETAAGTTQSLDWMN